MARQGARAGVTVDISKLMAKFSAIQQVVEEEATKMVAELTAEGARIARLALNDADTDYGRERMRRGQGNSTGRNDTGNMRNTLRALNQRKDSNGNIIGEVGWYFAKEYFKYQERGTGDYATEPNTYNPNWNYGEAYGRVRGMKPKHGIMGAHSLWTAQAAMERELPQRTRALKRAISKRANSK